MSSTWAALDFDNGFRWLAPWPDLNSGRLVVFPAVRRFRGQAWQRIPHEPLRGHPEMPVTSARVQRLLAPHRADLTRYPLYISLDKDVMTVEDALVNWDSGHLRLAEVETVLNVIRELAGESLRGMDIVGDWSPVRLQGLFRLFWHCTEHPALKVNPSEACRRNEATNLALLSRQADCWPCSARKAAAWVG